MSVTLQEAEAIHEALDQASKASPIRQLRDEFRVRAGEWRNAAKDFALSEDMDPGACVIELYGNVTRGMKLPSVYPDEPFVGVKRKLDRYGDLSLHIEDPHDPRGRYLSYFDATSPVVVKR